MNYSKEIILIMNFIFFSIVIIEAIVLSKYKKKDENKITLKLIGYIFLSSFKFNINSIPLPVGFISAYFLKVKSNSNQSTKTKAILIGGLLFILSLSPLQENVEQLIYPRDSINTYLLTEKDRTGYNISISEIGGTYMNTIFEHSEQGENFYEELFNLDKSDDFKLNDWKYNMVLHQDHKDERFRKLNFNISDDIKYISLKYEGEIYIFNTSEDFQLIFKKIIER